MIPKEIISRNKLIDTIKKYIKNYSIKTIVVGLPFDLYGKDKKRLQKTEKFIENLKNILIFIDCNGLQGYDRTEEILEFEN